MTDTQAKLVYVTTANADEAATIAKAVVGERLAACANIIGAMQSVYWWGGEVQQSPESVLLLKTRHGLIAKLTARIKALHSYDCPCVVVLNLEDGNPDFLNWIVNETS